jgi:hypothetical protein
LICFIKENHGGIFRKIAFSSMLEPFIKIKQENHVKNLKLKKIDMKIIEIKECLKQLFDQDNESIVNNDNESNYESKI